MSARNMQWSCGSGRDWGVYEQHNFPSEETVFSPIAAADEVLMGDEFLERFARPHPNDQKNPESVFQTLSRIVGGRVYRPGGTSWIPWDRWFERTKHNSRSLLVLGHVMLDFLLRCKPTQDQNARKTSISEGSEELQRHIEPCKDCLLNAIPRTHLDVYQRLIEPITNRGTSQKVRAGMAKALWLYSDRFTINIIYVRRLMNCVPAIEVDARTLRYICESTLDLSSRLPKSDADRIYDGYEAVISSAFERIAKRPGWDSFWRLLRSFASFEDGRVAARVVTADILERWKELAASCDDSEYKGYIVWRFERLRALAGIPAPRVDIGEQETEMDALMREKRELVAARLPTWVAERDRYHDAEQ
ncbi:hypothetical protein WOLCODRAFT_21536 [Wolfiporia cocos MD-104 SS10]|uniref:Uncharacterized protein n=1 Tax=Wolfiporia cocos (strain MD-104) TaxID=742152 RepID=A0A2H3JPE4_WOLCO|nr:hypothetical protein WOLCODRAFT_21536 [Wolfiporia cocos MD-104 SS10]